MMRLLFFFPSLLQVVQAVRELCGKYEQYRVDNYTWNNNVWNDDGSGWACTYVSDNPIEENHAFHVSWEWTGAPIVRGFPNIGLRTKQLPLRLRDLRSMTVSSSWAMAPASLISGASSDPNTEPNASALKSNDVEANVCIDVFADENRNRSLVYSEQKYEIMIWFGKFGKGAQPVGNETPLDPPVVTLIQDTEFILYTGTNYNGQIVHTWVANRTLTDFNMDLAPLFGFLAYKGILPVDVYLGTLQFGTETFSAAHQVNFSVTAFEASLVTANDTVSTATPTSNSSVVGGSSVVGSSSVGGENATQTEIDGVPIATQLDHPTSAAARHMSILYDCCGVAFVCFVALLVVIGN